MSDQNPYKPPLADLVQESNAALTPPNLWNPDVAGLWSLLFTPIFGSYIVLKNWLAIGEVDRIRTAKNWFIASLFMILPYIFIPGLALVFLIVWYFASQRKQTKFVNKHWGGSYTKRGWLKPVGIAFGITIGLYFVIFLVTLMIPIA